MLSRVPARLAASAIAVLLLLSLSVSLAAAGPPNGHGKAKGNASLTAGFSPDTIIIKPKAGVSDSAIAQFHGQKGAKTRKVFKKLRNLQVVEVPKGTKIQDLVVQYQKSGLVEFAEPDYVVQLDAIPNDPLYSQQWGLHNNGSNSPCTDSACVSGVDIDAEPAWDIRNDAQQVVVAVIDTGVDYRHPDLMANIWINALEDINSNGKYDNWPSIEQRDGVWGDEDGINQDGNDYVDDVCGIDPPNGDSDPMDTAGNSHGTHVAGIIGAEGNNATNPIGVCGVAWRVKIMPLKMFGDGYISDALECMEYAKSKGAHIINNSWSGYFHSLALEQGVQALQDPGEDGDASDGIGFVCSAGNGLGGVPQNNDSWLHADPASLAWSNIVSVTSIHCLDYMPANVNYGRWSVDLAAPGTEIVSTIKAAPGYGCLDGTSMAAPHVSGALAVLKAQYPSESIYHAIVRMYGGVRHNAYLEDITQFEGDLDLHGALTYVPSVNLAVTPENSLVSVGPQSGPFSPYAMSYVLTNFTANELDWTAEKTASWITLSADDGTLPPHGSQIVNVTLNGTAAALPVGVYTDVLTFTEVGNELEAVTRDITLKVAAMHVKTDGYDGDDGLTWETAKATFSNAIGTARGAGIKQIWVKKGDYTEPIYCDVWDYGLEIYGGFAGNETRFAERPAFPRSRPDANATILDGSATGGSAVYQADVTDVRIDGFTFRNWPGRAVNCFPWFSGIAPSPTIVNNTFIANSCGVYVDTGTATILNNVFDGNAGEGAVYLTGTDEYTLVANNVFYGNAANGVGGAIYSSGSSPLIVNNTITSNINSGEGGVVHLIGGNPILANNVIAYNYSGIWTDNDAIVVRHNDVYGNTAYNYLWSGGAWNPTGSNGNISAVPQFASLTYGNYHIQNASPCKNTGDNTYVDAGAKDMDGQARIQSTTVDMGADESNGQVWQDTPPVIVRVKPTGDDDNDGSSWAAAKRTLQAAIDTVTEKSGEVWVLTGQYKERIQLRSRVHVYGGFNGYESSRAAANWKHNPTFIDGERGGSVVTAVNGCTPATLCGFTIINGTGTILDGPYGGSAYGGGIFCRYAAPAILSCSIIGNTAYQGGGIYIESGSPIIASNRILSNSAYMGGGVFSVYSDTLLANNTLVGNYATYDGGGLNLSAPYDSPVARVYNNIVAFNTDGVSGGGSEPVFVKNDFYGNTAFDCNSSLGWYPIGTDGNISADPKLRDIAYGDIHIPSDSPCTNTGDNSMVQPSWLDIDAQARISAGTVDMGADEYFANTWMWPPLLYYVSPTGNDDYHGRSWQYPKRTIQCAINAAVHSGAEVWVKAGTYNERIALLPYVHVYGGFFGNEGGRDQRNPMTNISIIDGQSGGSVVSALAGMNVSRIDGFTVRNGTGLSKSGSTYGGGIYVDKAAPLIANNMVTQNSAQYGAGIYLSGNSPVTVTRNTITANTGPQYTYGAGISCDQCAAALIDANTISGNTPGSGSYGVGIYLSYSLATITNNVIADNVSSSGYGGGIYSDGVYAPTIVNNTIVGNDISGGSGGGLYLPGGGLVQNNIVISNPGGYGIYGGGTPTIDNNDVWDNSPDNYYGVTPGQGNIYANPQFLDAANSNYRLTYSSACINAGEDTGAPDHDWDGSIRPDVVVPPNDHTDIGAYEYGYSLGALTADLPDGTLVEVSDIHVSAVFPQLGRIYVQRLDRVSGIRVDTANTYSIGTALRIRGTLQTDTTLAERYIQPTAGYPYTIGGYGVYPLGMNNLWTNQSAAKVMPQADGNIPFCSAGLLTSTWGTVVVANTTPTRYIAIEDGSSDILVMGWSADIDRSRVFVLLPSDAPMRSVGDFVKVTGINGNFLLNGSPVQGLKPRDQNDIVAVTTWDSTPISGLETGKNYLALPGIPRYPSPETVFYGCTGGPGIGLTWALARWVPRNQSWLYYGYCGEAPWGDCMVGEGYELNIPSDGNHCYVYDRTPVTGDQVLYLPFGSGGYSTYGFAPQYNMAFIGNPFSQNRPWSGVKVSDGVRLKTLAQAISCGWIHQVLKWYDGEWTPINVSTESMEARKAYKVYPARNGLSMHVQAP